MQSVSNSCGRALHVRHASAIGESGTVTLGEGPAGTGLLQLPELPDLPLTCHYRGRDFHCAADKREPVAEGRDATVITSVTASGRFDDPDTLTGSLDVAIGCEGVYCFALELHGCTIEKTFTATTAVP